MKNNIKDVDTLEVAQAKSEIVGPWAVAWDRFKKNKVAMFGAVLFIVILILTIVGPWLSPYSLNQYDLTMKKLPPSSSHWLGTDEQGRDVLLRLFLGGRTSILVGVIAAVLTVFIGSLVGGIAGYV